MILDFTSPLRHFFSQSSLFPQTKKVQGIQVGVFMVESFPSKTCFFVTGSSRLFTDDEVDEGTPSMDLEQNEEPPD